MASLTVYFVSVERLMADCPGSVIVALLSYTFAMPFFRVGSTFNWACAAVRVISARLTRNCFFFVVK